MRFLLALACSMAICRAATDLPPAIRQSIETARAAPPEFFADTVIRMVQSGRIPQKNLQIQLLVDAFHAAGDAREPVRLNAIQATPPDTRAMYRGKAGALQLDALSLQSRSLRELLALDPQKAREFFDQIVHTPQDPRTCADALVPDLSAYYDIAGGIARVAFTKAEKEKNVHVQFFETVLSQVKSPGDLAAFAQALESVPWSPDEFELLLGSFSRTMESMDANFRGFEASIEAMQREMDALTAHASAAHIATEGLVKAYRKYMVTQLTGPRCNDNFSGAQDAMAWLGAHAAPLSPDETKPSKTEGVVKAEPYFKTPDSEQLGNELRQLGTLSRSAPEWPNRLLDFLGHYSSWQPTGDDTDAFHQRATILRALLGVVPPGEDRDRVVAMCSTLIESSSAEHQNPAEWLWQTKTLLEAAGRDASKMLASFRESGDPALSIYAGSQ